jgi:hypothetical protein
MNGVGLLLIVLAAAALANGLIAGASLDRSVVQLPARHKIGVRAYSAYSVAHELEGAGRIWYPVLGIGSALLTIAAAVAAIATRVSLLNGLAIYVAAIAAILHSLATARAAPVNFRQRAAQGDEAGLTQIIDTFEKWHAARAVLQLASFAGTVVALATIGRVGA